MTLKITSVISRSNRPFKLALFVGIILAFGILQAYAITSGQQLWVKRYNAPIDGGDWARASAIDSSNNVYVLGTSRANVFDFDFALVKYGPTGSQKWARRYNGPGNDFDNATAIAIDSNNNVYIGGSTGEFGSDNEDFALVKYDPAGNRKWVRHYSGPGDRADSMHKIAIDSNNNVYVIGSIHGGSTKYDYAIIKYSSAGTRRWARRYNGPGNGDDWVSAIAIDKNNNAYVAGSSYGGVTSKDDLTVIKYDQAGNRKWIKRYKGSGNGDDHASSIAIDSDNNIYAAGSSISKGSTGQDFIVIKYKSDGMTKWIKHYNGSGNGFDSVDAIAVDKDNNIYVAGVSSSSSTQRAFITIKYDAAGSRKWVRCYNGPGNYDEPRDIAVAKDGNIYVAGDSYGTWTLTDFALVKYDTTGNRKWVRRYSGKGINFDQVSDIAIDGKSNVYVTGSSDGGSTDYDFTTIKYAP